MGKKRRPKQTKGRKKKSQHRRDTSDLESDVNVDVAAEDEEEKGANFRAENDFIEPPKSSQEEEAQALSPTTSRKRPKEKRSRISKANLNSSSQTIKKSVVNNVLDESPSDHDGPTSNTETAIKSANLMDGDQRKEHATELKNEAARLKVEEEAHLEAEEEIVKPKAKKVKAEEETINTEEDARLKEKEEETPATKNMNEQPKELKRTETNGAQLDETLNALEEAHQALKLLQDNHNLKGAAEMYTLALEVLVETNQNLESRIDCETAKTVTKLKNEINRMKGDYDDLMEKYAKKDEEYSANILVEKLKLDSLKAEVVRMEIEQNKQFKDEENARKQEINALRTQLHKVQENASRKMSQLQANADQVAEEAKEADNSLNFQLKDQQMRTIKLPKSLEEPRNVKIVELQAELDRALVEKAEMNNSIVYLQEAAALVLIERDSLKATLVDLKKQFEEDTRLLTEMLQQKDSTIQGLEEELETREISWSQQLVEKQKEFEIDAESGYHRTYYDGKSETKAKLGTALDAIKREQDIIEKSTKEGVADREALQELNISLDQKVEVQKEEIESLRNDLANFRTSSNQEALEVEDKIKHPVFYRTQSTLTNSYDPNRRSSEKTIADPIEEIEALQEQSVERVDNAEKTRIEVERKAKRKAEEEDRLQVKQEILKMERDLGIDSSFLDPFEEIKAFHEQSVSRAANVEEKCMEVVMEAKQKAEEEERLQVKQEILKVEKDLGIHSSFLADPFDEIEAIQEQLVSRVDNVEKTRMEVAMEAKRKTEEEDRLQVKEGILKVEGDLEIDFMKPQNPEEEEVAGDAHSIEVDSHSDGSISSDSNFSDYSDSEFSDDSSSTSDGISISLDSVSVREFEALGSIDRRGTQNVIVSEEDDQPVEELKSRRTKKYSLHNKYKISDEAKIKLRKERKKKKEKYKGMKFFFRGRKGETLPVRVSKLAKQKSNKIFSA